VTLMQSEDVKVRLVNNTYDATLELRTANFLNTQGMQVTEFGPPNGYASRTKVILYTSKLYALRYLKDLFGLDNSHIVIRPDPASTVDIEIRLGEDGVSKFSGGY